MQTKRESFLISLAIRWVVTTGAVWVTVFVLQSQMKEPPKMETIILAGLILGLLNALVRPIVIVLTLPATLFTFGLFIFLINAFMLWLTSYFSYLIGRSFEFNGFGWVLLASLLISIVSALLNRLVKGPSESKIDIRFRNRK
ncbi:phage holin family protein [Candidatus Acetothermia bacterium]|nr:phage holin family protein [Candidatus Acetothermia bacterium]